ncbi:copper chaperone PCu(A)C [Cribrihabitans pelagius]|uniref:copper chaperone PCu(A)C n=1 Tax=Cribrihabitans pelagius TaxID=1765746 RepID=UPI003B5C4C17
MSLKSLVLAAASAAALSVPALSLPALAEAMKPVMVEDAYVRVASKAAKAGAAFMQIANHGAEDDRLVEVRSDVAARVQLHTHEAGGGGVMKMRHVEDGFAIPAGEGHALKRGGDHVMFMGLKRSLEHGDMVPLTLVFENAGEITLEVPVDLERKLEAHGGVQHGETDHSGHSN